MTLGRNPALGSGFVTGIRDGAATVRGYAVMRPTGQSQGNSVL